MNFPQVVISKLKYVVLMSNNKYTSEQALGRKALLCLWNSETVRRGNDAGDFTTP